MRNLFVWGAGMVVAALLVGSFIGRPSGGTVVFEGSDQAGNEYKVLLADDGALYAYKNEDLWWVGEPDQVNALRAGGLDYPQIINTLSEKLG